MSTTTSIQPDRSLVKARQQQTWASGDYTAVASRIVLVSELLAETADLHAGWRVLDVACGNGNAALAAARSGTTAVGRTTCLRCWSRHASALWPKGSTRSSAPGMRRRCRSARTSSTPCCRCSARCSRLTTDGALPRWCA